MKRSQILPFVSESNRSHCRNGIEKSFSIISDPLLLDFFLVPLSCTHGDTAKSIIVVMSAPDFMAGEHRGPRFIVTALQYILNHFPAQVKTALTFICRICRKVHSRC
jgi:hypothetical protein